MIRLLRAALAATVLLTAPAFAHNGVVHLGPLNISVPFARATLPNAPVGGAFFTIENTGTEPDRLISASSPAAGDVQIHEMAMQGDVMKMRELPDGLEIPAGQTVALTPGGFHLMFMGLKQAFVEGETVPVTLVFEKAGTVDLALPVMGIAADAAAPMAMKMH
ncbi:MAG: copper chaperone PCu(A)C [Devosia sp.]